MRKRWAFASITFASIILFSQRGFAQPLKTVTMVRTTGSIGMVPLEFSVNRGYFKKQGLDVQLITVRQSDVIIAATVNGELNFMDIIPTAILASVRGLPIRTIAVVLNRAPYVLIGQPNLRSPAELKGKKIGVSSVGGMSAYLVRNPRTQWSQSRPGCYLSRHRGNVGPKRGVVRRHHRCCSGGGSG